MSNALDDIVDYLLEDMPVPLTAAERTRQWRAKKRAAGKPDNKAVDGAIAESVSYLMSRATTAPVLVDAAQIVQVATVCLVRDGYNRRRSRNMVVCRLRPREEHKSFSHMPSTQPHANPALVQPPHGGGSWSEDDLDLIRQLAGRTYQRAE